MALFPCNAGGSSDELVNVPNGYVFGLGGNTNQSETIQLENGIATVKAGNIATTYVVNIKGRGYTNLHFKAQSSSMNWYSRGIKADGTLKETGGGSNTGTYPTNDVTDVDLLIVNVYTSGNAVNCIFTFT